MDRKIKIGVFGAFRGKCMIDVLANHPDAELTAVCDKYKPLLEEVKKLSEAKNLNVAVYEDFEEFFKHDMDAVVLANYANEHAIYAVRLLKSGRHVMSEVLPCETMAQAVELAEAVEESGKIYAYAENYSYMTRTFEMRRRYEAGEIGEVQYAEGEYVHDCSSIWPGITYGDPTHWRNRMYSTYYCTHSVGPMLTITGRRPVQVVGFETNPNTLHASNGFIGVAGIILITLDNGAIAKSLHGGLKREPGSVNYEVYGTKGMMETERWDEQHMSLYRESDKVCVGNVEKLAPVKFISPELAKTVDTHGGSDFYATHFFLQKILGREEGKYSIDVYTALDMGICGILAYRSILNGNIPIKVPNFRNKEEREQYRYDTACTNPKIAGERLLPVYHDGVVRMDDAEYARIRKLWEEGKNNED